jgi:hypothetical protein
MCKVKKERRKEMRSREEILNALNIMKEVCEEAISCLACPLGDKDGICVIQEGGLNPCEWYLKKPEKVWRAFDK